MSSTRASSALRACVLLLAVALAACDGKRDPEDCTCPAYDSFKGDPEGTSCPAALEGCDCDVKFQCSAHISVGFLYACADGTWKHVDEYDCSTLPTSSGGQ